MIFTFFGSLLKQNSCPGTARPWERDGGRVNYEMIKGNGQCPKSSSRHHWPHSCFLTHTLTLSLSLPLLLSLFSLLLSPSLFPLLLSIALFLSPSSSHFLFPSLSPIPLPFPLPHPHPLSP